MDIKLTTFQQNVYQAASQIPRGKVSTYAEIARVIGRPQASRAVGNALHVNPFAPQVPCHRVVKNDGSLGGFFSGESRKIKMLKQEGVFCQAGKVVDFDSRFFRLTKLAHHKI